MSKGEIKDNIGLFKKVHLEKKISYMGGRIKKLVL
jgi:hypothetical protein